MEHSRWMVQVLGEEPSRCDTAEDANDLALEWADATPGLEVAIYELTAIACAKVIKAKVRPSPVTRIRRTE
jgi:hypothetical protein